MLAALARMVAVLRGVTAAVAVVSALLGAAGLSWWWLGPALLAVAGWTFAYVRVSWRSGLQVWLVSVDALIASALFLVISHLVAAAAIQGTVNWVALIGSMTAVSAQLGARVALSLPLGLLVAASAVVGSRPGHGAAGLGGEGVLIASQSVVAALVMLASLRIERAAEAAFSNLEEIQTAAELERSLREEERAQLRLMHNGPLTTLSMALKVDAAWAHPMLRERAAATLSALSRLVLESDSGDDETRLHERLAQVVVWYEPPLIIAADLKPCLVSGDIADSFAAACMEALENVVRHAGTDRAAVVLREHEGSVEVTVADEGCGFEPARVRGMAFGLRQDLAGRMEAVGGSAAVESQPGAGTAVKLAWRRD
jgi:signal transduction histidine kinase